MTDSADSLSVELRDLAPRPTVAVRLTAPTPSLGELFGIHLPNIADRIADLGGEPAGAPFARYHDMTDDEVDVEMGIPVVAPVGNLRPVGEAELGEVAAGELPGGPVAITVHRGPYDALGGTWRQLEAWLQAAGHRVGAAPWESYVDDPTEVEDASQLRTEVIWPIG